jgi:hypothetical protein
MDIINGALNNSVNEWSSYLHPSYKKNNCKDKLRNRFAGN